MRRIRTLLLDDQPSVRKVVRELLEELGCEVAEANDAREALGLLSTDSWDLFISDLRMPGMNGLEAVRAARALRPGLGVILLSGLPHAPYAAAARAAGADAFLSKERAPEQLGELIASVLGARGLAVQADTAADGASVKP